jgi:hypothetical protein
VASFSVLKTVGLATTNNQLSAVPEGGMVRATNAVLRNKYIIECRRGQFRNPNTLAELADRGLSGAIYQERLVFHHGLSEDRLSRYTFDSPSEYPGTYLAPATGRRVRFAEAGGNLYFTTAAGVFLLDSLAGPPMAGGVVRAWDFVTGTQLIPGDAWMPADTAVAYRVVWGTKDANNNVKLGAPNAPVVVRNGASFTAAIGTISKNGAGVLTVTKPGHGFGMGESVAISPGETGIPAGTYAVVVTSSSTFTLTVGGASPAGLNTLAQVLTVQTKSVNVRVPIPDGLTDAYFARIYRTELTPLASVAPLAEFFLLKELSFDSATILLDSFDYNDITPDSMLSSVPLYTNPNTGDGDVNGNERPPICTDVTVWDDRLWCISTTDKHRFYVRMLGVGSPEGVQNNDTFTVDGVTLTAKTAPVLGTDFRIFTDGSPTQNVERTARDLADTITNFTGGTLVAYYVAGESEDIGSMLIERREVSAASFTVFASRVTSWDVPLGATDVATSTNDARPSGLSYSKIGEYEAFPLTNWLPVGPANSEALRALPFRDKMYVGSKLGKFYTVSGQAPYAVNELDGSARLIAPESMVVHANQVFALTDQGVGILSDAGFRIVSRGIEDELLDVLALNPAVVSELAFGVSYESDRQYILFVPTADTDTCATRAFVFNSLDETWTSWIMARTFGLVSPVDGRLVLGDGEANTVRIERKSYDFTDFADEELSATLLTTTNSGDGFYATLTLDSVADVEVGDVITQNTYDARTLVIAVDEDTNVVTVSSSESYDVPAAVTIFKAIPVELKWCPSAPGGPADINQFRDVVMHFREFACHEFTVTYDTETVLAEQSAALAPADGFGSDPFGYGAFGFPMGLRNRRAEVARSAQMASYIRVGARIRQAWAIWALNGFTLHLEAAGTASKP